MAQEGRKPEQNMSGVLLYMTKHDHEIKKFISILMESSLYLTLTLKERQSLLERLASSYPLLDDGEDVLKETESG